MMYKQFKKRRSLRQIFAFVLSLALLLSNLTSIQVQANTAGSGNDGIATVSGGDTDSSNSGSLNASGTYVFDAATDSVITTLEKKATVPEGKYGTDGYFTFSGTITRGNSSTYSAEFAKVETGKASFTVFGEAEATFTITSTGSSNSSDFVLMDASGNRVVPKGATEAVVVVTGTDGLDVSYTGLVAGTYTICSPSDGANNGRGFRLLNAEVSEASTGASTEYTFEAKTDSVISTLEKKATVPEGKYGTDGYFTFSGAITRGNSSTYSAEFAKAETGKASFTVTGSAEATFTITSTGSSNSSDFVLMDASGNRVVPKGATEAVVVVTGTDGLEVSYTGLAAGTYTICSPADGANNGRGFRLLNAKVSEAPASVTTEYTFEAKTDSVISTLEKKATVPEGKYGTDGYFTFSGAITRGNSSTYSAEFAKAETGKASFTVTGSAEATFTITSTGSSNSSDFVLMDASGNRVVPKGATEAVVVVTGTDGLEVSYTDLAAGSYTICSPADGANNGRGFRLLNATVADTTGGSRPARADWSTVAAPVIVSAKQNTEKDNTIDVVVNADVSYDGADLIKVTMADATGAEVASKNSAKEEAVHNVSFNPTASGTYTFSVVAVRDGETDKPATETASAEFVLKLEAPYVSSATNAGNGSVVVEWDAVAEATGYVVTVKDTDIRVEATELTTTLEGLTVGSTYTIYVAAIRGNETSETGSIDVTVSGEAQRKWSFAAFGPSTNTEKNGYEGNINDGSVTVFSEGGKGKIQPTSLDGLAFYYTEIDPETENFTLTATINVDSWTYSNGQEGFGIMVSDTIGEHGSDKGKWSNAFQIASTKIEYRYDGENVTTDTSAPKVTMKLGLGTIAKTGITAESLADVEAGVTTSPAGATFDTFTLESAAGGLEGDSHNLIGAYTGAGPGGDLDDLLTTLRLQIQRNNTGYVLRYLDAEDNVISEKLYYDLERNALTQIDEDTIYLGFFASRNARITVTDVELTTIHPDDDEAAEDREIEYVYPINTVESATFSNTAEYEFVYYGNADGQLTVTNATGDVLIDTKFEALTKERFMVNLNNGENPFNVTFVPDPDYVPGEYKEMTSYETVKLTHNVEYKAFNSDYLYVSPTGVATAAGTKDAPMDIYTAVKIVAPGQTIVVMEGTYNLSSTVTVERGIDGTAENMIYMIADPDAETRPVFDFGGNCAGMVFAGDYWYFYGFDVTKSADGQKGIQVSGNNNVLDNIKTYKNGNTGIQISRYKGTDEWEDWPANNLVLNCTSYLNADKGYEDADGFAAKLTVADGNVFDGCIAAYNADDGWDLYAKVATGPIGEVVIKNSVAFKNGYLIDDAGAVVNAGNGNGFKMGGESISGAHQVINSIAFANKAKGIDSNSGPNIQAYDCTSFDNESYNVAFYTNNAVNTAYKAEGVLSYKKSNTVAEQLKEKGTQVSTDIYGVTNYYFSGSKSVNTENAEVSDDWFVSLDTAAAITGITRNEDFTINMNGYLELTDVADKESGARMTGTPSKVFEKIEIETGYDVVDKLPEEIVEAVKGVTGCETVEELEAYLKVAITTMEEATNILKDVKEENTKVVDIVVWKEVNGTKVPVTAADFPVEVFISYAALNSEEALNAEDFDYVVGHMFIEGANAGKMEFLTVEKTAEGIKFVITSASPFIIGWVAAADDVVPTPTPIPTPTPTPAPSTGDGQGTGTSSTPTPVPTVDSQTTKPSSPKTYNDERDIAAKDIVEKSKADYPIVAIGSELTAEAVKNNNMAWLWFVGLLGLAAIALPIGVHKYLKRKED